MEDKKQLLLSKVKSSLGALLYHDRKECEDLNREDVSLTIRFRIHEQRRLKTSLH